MDVSKALKHPANIEKMMGLTDKNREKLEPEDELPDASTNPDKPEKLQSEK